MKEAINQMAKSERAVELKRVVENILNDEIAKSEEWDKNLVINVLEAYKKKIVRDQIVMRE